MTELFERIALSNNKKWMGWEGKMIIDEKGTDGSFVGRNFSYKPIIIKGDHKLGDEVKVKVLYATSYDLRGKVLDV